MFLSYLANDVTDGNSISPAAWDDMGLRKYEVEIYNMDINRDVNVYFNNGCVKIGAKKSKMLKPIAKI